jgi:GT2 family glycosyltransferase
VVDLSIIIVTYNSDKFIRDCLNSIQNEKENLSSTEVIVVDNDSRDQTVNIIEKEFPWVYLIKNRKNIGLARANNQGIDISSGKYLLFLNPDTKILQGSLVKLINFMETTPDVGVVGIKLLYPDGTIQYSCREFPNIRVILFRRTILGKLFGKETLNKYLMSDWDHNEIKEVDWVLGAFLAIPRKVLNEVGCFDPTYKLYFEDIDLCYRVKKAGYKIYYYPDAEAIHYYQRESKNLFSIKALWHIQSAVIFFRKFGWKF